MQKRRTVPMRRPSWSSHPAVVVCSLVIALALAWWLVSTRTEPRYQFSWFAFAYGVGVGLLSLLYYEWDSRCHLDWYLYMLLGKRSRTDPSWRWQDLVAYFGLVGLIVWVPRLGAADWPVLAAWMGVSLGVPTMLPRYIWVWREAWRVYRERTGATMNRKRPGD